MSGPRPMTSGWFPLQGPPAAEPNAGGVMAWEAWLVLVVVLVALLCMVLEMRPPEHIMLGALVLFWNAGIVSADEVLHSYGNSGVFTIGALFVVVQAVDRSKVVARLVRKLLGRRSGERAARARLCVACFCLSAFVSNTPLVALFLPLVREWARNRGFAASKFLMPLSYATILGGLLTTIGTSTNLLVNGFMEQQGLEPFSFFEPGYVALPVGLASLTYLVLVGHRFLPDHRGGFFRELREHGDNLVTALELTPESKLIGRGVFEVLQKCGLPQDCLLKIRRQRPPPWPRRVSFHGNGTAVREREAGSAGGAAVPAVSSVLEQEAAAAAPATPAAAGDIGSFRRRVFSLHPAADISPGVDREAGLTEIFPVPDHETAQVGDRLVLSISREALINLVSSHRQDLLVSNVPALQIAGPSSEFVELVLGFMSPVVGQPICQGARLFETMYRAGLIAVRRRGVAPKGAARMPVPTRSTSMSSSPRPDEATADSARAGPVFAAGDTVLVLAPVGVEFSRSHFLLVTRVAELPPTPKLWDYLPLPMFLGGLLLVALGVVPMVQVAVTLCALFVLCGWVEASEVRAVVDWQLLILIGASLGVSQAVQRSGLSLAMAQLIKAAGFSPRGALAVLFLTTMLMTEVITNNAAAALSLPLAIDLAKELNLSSPRPLAMAVMIAASTSFACPIGYTTNLMVLGPGGYSFGDFFRAGIAIDLISLVGVSLIVPLIWPLE